LVGSIDLELFPNFRFLRIGRFFLYVEDTTEGFICWLTNDNHQVLSYRESRNDLASDRLNGSVDMQNDVRYNHFLDVFECSEDNGWTIRTARVLATSTGRGKKLSDVQFCEFRFYPDKYETPLKTHDEKVPDDEKVPKKLLDRVDVSNDEMEKLIRSNYVINGIVSTMRCHGETFFVASGMDKTVVFHFTSGLNYVFENINLKKQHSCHNFSLCSATEMLFSYVENKVVHMVSYMFPWSFFFPIETEGVSHRKTLCL